MSQWIAIVGTLLLLTVDEKPCQKFVIDASKPYTYLVYDHSGLRAKVRDEDSIDGVWIRLVNNSVVPISIEKIAHIKGDPGIIVPDVIKVAPCNDWKAEAESSVECQMAPKNYAYEVGSLEEISPGKEILLSFPRNHVGPKWDLQIRVQLGVNNPALVSLGPWSVLSFSESMIPKATDSSQRSGNVSVRPSLHSGPIGIEHEVNHLHSNGP